MADLSQQERATLAQIDQLTDPKKLRVLIANARRLKSRAVEAAAFRRLCFVQPEANPDTVEHDVWQSIYALEELKREAAGKTVLLHRTRQKIKRDGEAKTVSDLTLKGTASSGLDDLINLDLPKLTFEAVVLRHPRTFDPEIQEAARARLLNAGVTDAAALSPAKGHANG